MTVTVLLLADPAAPEVNLRCEAVAAFLTRLHAVAGESAALVSAPEDPAAAVAGLAGAAALIGEGDEVRYVPTPAARHHVAEAKDGAWPPAVASRQHKFFRSSRGSIVGFPLEDTTVGDPTAEVVEVFTTDWTAIPSACGIAVHPTHPLSTGLPPGESAAFTGRYCRHPLNGGLLPIWVADWVKPEFGTGAVGLNPGHDRADLEFCRQVGLPVRFSLGPEGYDGARGSPLRPPFLRSGVAVHTGIADGMPYDQAAKVYFGIMAERGLAVPYTDPGMGTFAVARIEPVNGTEVVWDPARRTVAVPGTPGESVRLAPSAVLSAVGGRVRDTDLIVVVPSSQVECDLLALRLLLAEPRLEPAVQSPPAVVVVGGATIRHDADDGVLRLALLVAAAALDMVALKPQQVEPCERFLKVHDNLAGTLPDATVAPSHEVTKAAGQVKGLLLRGDLKQAFTQLYRLQKTLAKGERVGGQDLAGYLVLAHVLAGVDSPHRRGALADMWRQI